MNTNGQPVTSNDELRRQLDEVEAENLAGIQTLKQRLSDRCRSGERANLAALRRPFPRERRTSQSQHLRHLETADQTGR